MGRDPTICVQSAFDPKQADFFDATALNKFAKDRKLRIIAPYESANLAAFLYHLGFAILLYHIFGTMSTGELYDQNTFGIVGFLCSKMLHTTLPVVAEIIKPQTVLLRVDKL